MMSNGDKGLRGGGTTPSAPYTPIWPQPSAPNVSLITGQEAYVSPTGQITLPGPAPPPEPTYSLGDIIEQPGGWPLLVTGFYDDGEPILEPLSASAEELRRGAGDGVRGRPDGALHETDSNRRERSDGLVAGDCVHCHAMGGGADAAVARR